MFRMRSAQREIEKMDGEEIEASAEAVVIADAIYAGLERIAQAIEYHARVSAGEDDSEIEPPKYLDGSPAR